MWIQQKQFVTMKQPYQRVYLSAYVLRLMTQGVFDQLGAPCVGIMALFLVIIQRLFRECPSVHQSSRSNFCRLCIIHPRQAICCQRVSNFQPTIGSYYSQKSSFSCHWDGWSACYSLASWFIRCILSRRVQCILPQFLFSSQDNVHN